MGCLGLLSLCCRGITGICIGTLNAVTSVSTSVTLCLIPTRGFSLLECCVGVYCCNKISKCYTDTKEAIKHCYTSAKTTTIDCCASTRDSIMDCCKSVTSICNSDHINNPHQEQQDVELGGVTNVVDSAVMK